MSKSKNKLQNFTIQSRTSVIPTVFNIAHHRNTVVSITILTVYST